MHVHQDLIRASERSVWVTQILFALVLANGLVAYKDLILHPIGTNGSHLLGSFGLVVVYLTTLLSWLDFSRTMDKRPYFYGTRWERLRFLVDVGIVVLYAYLLFAVEYTLERRNGDISRFILGFPLIYAGYLASGILRVRMYGSIASRMQAIFVFLLIFLGLLIAYSDWYNYIGDSTGLNFAFIVACGFSVVLYRSYRRLLSKRHTELRDKGLRIGIDVDGVLADQIVGVLPIIKEMHGISLVYTDIVDWRLPIGTTSIDQEIELAQRSESYVREMPVHEGAREQLCKLAKKNKIFIVTARRSECDPWTIEWLLTNRICFDQYVNSHMTSKGQHEFDVLVDDHSDNIRDFLKDTPGYGVLFDRPWNRERTELDQWQRNGRMAVVKNWHEVDEAIARVKNRRAQSMHQAAWEKRSA